MYLTTHDKQDFYGHLGYEFCDPVVSLGGASTLLSNEQVGSSFCSLHFRGAYRVQCDLLTLFLFLAGCNAKFA